MNKQAPSVGQLITIAGFALSCFALLLFVWTAFGGPTPLASSGYKLKMPMVQIGQLAEQSAVMVSGVEVGRVTKIDLGEDEQAAEAIVTLEIEPEYAPMPEDTRAILRAKSLLGEAYIELTPGDKRSGALPDGSELPAAQVAKSVQLDEIFRTFDERTREAFKQGAIDNSIAMLGRGATMNQALGVLPGTLTELNDVLTVLNEEDKDVTKLIKNTGVVFDAISKRRGQLSGMIRNTNTVFQTTAQRNVELQEFFRIFPTFLRESRATQERLGDFSQFATPVMNKMVPVAEQLSPTLKASADLAPESKRLYKSLKPVIRKAPKAFPAARAFLDEDATNLLNRVPDYFAEFNPFLESAAYYRKELAALLGNAAAGTNGAVDVSSRGLVRFVRAGVTIGPESFTAFTGQQASSTRSNAYTATGKGLDVNAGGLPSFDTTNCTATINGVIPDWTALSPVQQAQYTQNTRYLDAADAETLYNNLLLYGTSLAQQTNNIPQPACIGQAPFTPLGDSSQPATPYQHVFREP